MLLGGLFRYSSLRVVLAVPAEDVDLIDAIKAAATTLAQASDVSSLLGVDVEEMGAPTIVVLSLPAPSPAPPPSPHPAPLVSPLPSAPPHAAFAGCRAGRDVRKRGGRRRPGWRRHGCGRDRWVGRGNGGRGDCVAGEAKAQPRPTDAHASELRSGHRGDVGDSAFRRGGEGRRGREHV